MYQLKWLLNQAEEAIQGLSEAKVMKKILVGWTSFIHLHSTVDEFAIHLIKPIWPKAINQIQDAILEAKEHNVKINNVKNPFIGTLYSLGDGKWIATLLRKAFSHPNPSARRYLIKEVNL